MPRSTSLRAYLMGVLAVTLFGGAFAAGAGAKPLHEYLHGWRGWDDIAIASVYVRDGAFPVGPYAIGNTHRRQSPEFRAFRRPVMKAFRTRPVTDGWVAVDTTELLGQRAFPVTRVDDSGRAFFLGLLFRGTGAIRPLFIIWMPILFVALALGWLAFELSIQGKALAALLVALLVSGSAFFREASATGYAAYGFYFAAGISLMAFSVAMSARDRSAWAWCRLAIASGVLGLAVPARSAAWLMAPAFLLAWTWAFWEGSSWRKRVMAFGVGFLALVLGPQLVARGIDRYSKGTLQQANRASWPTPGAAGHDTWPTLWIGLGDFDRTHGHQYLDEAARQIAVAGGFTDRIDPGAEAHFRNIILSEIAGDPVWFAGILAQRVRASFFLEKLWPSARASGQTYAPSSHPNEGAFDSYLSFTPTADLFGWGRGAFEAPARLLWVGWPLLVLVHLRPRRPGPVGFPAAVLIPSLLGWMASPVIVTVASGIEMQAVAGVHLLAWALALDALSRRLFSRRSDPLPAQPALAS